MKYKFFLFLFIYLLTGLALTFVFLIPEAHRQYYFELDKRCAEDKQQNPPCGFPAICIGPSGCFGPEFSNSGYFKTREPYIKIITWPTWFYKFIE